MQHKVISDGAGAAECEHVAVLKAAHSEEVLISWVASNGQHSEWNGSRSQAL